MVRQPLYTVQANIPVGRRDMGSGRVFSPDDRPQTVRNDDTCASIGPDTKASPRQMGTRHSDRGNIADERVAEGHEEFQVGVYAQRH
jgi:hypothetical protein